MIEFMKFCERYGIELVSDETYALTRFSNEDIPNPASFTSLLSIDKTEIIDPELCHVIHGIGNVSNHSKYS